MITERLDIDNYINSKKQSIIDSFVLFYGEDKRAEITERINNTVFIGYVNPHNYLTLVGELNSSCKSIAVDYFFNTIGISFENEEQKKQAIINYFGSGTSLTFTNLEMFYKNILSDKESNKNMANIYLNNIIGKELEPGTTEYIYEVNRIMSYKEVFDNTIKIYENEISKYKEYTDRLENVNNIIKQVQQELEKAFEKKMYELLSDEDKEVYNNSSYVIWNTLKSSYLFSDYSMSYRYDSSSDFFNKESDEKLLDPNTGEYTKKRIIEERIKYFKKMGINLGDNYEDYINNDSVKAIYPDKTIVEYITKWKKIFRMLEEERIIKEIPYNKDLFDRLLKENYIIKPNEAMNVIINNITCILTNYIKTETGELIEKPIMFISALSDPATLDCRIMHECNHAYELTLDSVQGNTITSLVGWDYAEDDMDSDVELSLDKPEKRNYELFNEIINELLAQDITKLAHDNNIYIMGDETISKDSSQSSYEEYKCLVEDFYKEYKDVIIESRHNNNIGLIYDKVGKENFDKLNELIIEYREYFNFSRLYKAKMDIVNHVESNEALMYKQFYNRSREILDQMKDYSNQIKK